MKKHIERSLESIGFPKHINQIHLVHDKKYILNQIQTLFNRQSSYFRQKSFSDFL